MAVPLFSMVEQAYWFTEHIAAARREIAETRAAVNALAKILSDLEIIDPAEFEAVFKWMLAEEIASLARRQGGVVEDDPANS